MRPEIQIFYDANTNELINSSTGVTTGVISPSIFRNNEYLLKIKLYNVYPTEYDVSAIADWKNGIGNLGTTSNPLVESNNASINTEGWANTTSGNITVIVNTHSTTLDADLGTLDQKLYSNELKGDNVTTIAQFDIFVHNTVYED